MSIASNANSKDIVKVPKGRVLPAVIVPVREVMSKLCRQVVCDGPAVGGVRCPHGFFDSTGVGLNGIFVRDPKSPTGLSLQKYNCSMVVAHGRLDVSVWWTRETVAVSKDDTFDYGGQPRCHETKFDHDPAWTERIVNTTQRAYWPAENRPRYWTDIAENPPRMGKPKTMSLAAFVTRYLELPSEHTHLVDRVAADMLAVLNADGFTIKMLSGPEIIDEYALDNCASNSCMTGASKSYRIHFYAANPATCQLAVLKHPDGRSIARCLIWTDTQGRKLFDQTYPSGNMESMRLTSQLQASSPGILPVASVTKPIVKMTLPPNGAVAYLDSFYNVIRPDPSARTVYLGRNRLDLVDYLDKQGVDMTNSEEMAAAEVGDGGIWWDRRKDAGFDPESTRTPAPARIAGRIGPTTIRENYEAIEEERQRSDERFRLGRRLAAAYGRRGPVTTMFDRLRAA